MKGESRRLSPQTVDKVAALVRSMAYAINFNS